MKKFIIFIVVCIFTTSCAFGAALSKKVSKASIDLEVETKDGFLLTSKLYMPKEKRKKYPLVVLLHSLGYSSAYWIDLQSKFNQAGFAVLEMDFRGHGKSIYTANFRKTNWRYMSEKTYKKYPSDVCDVLLYVSENYKNISVSNMAIVGADIGANTAILASSKLKTKPIALVLISPSAKFKGLYTPIILADIGNVPICVPLSAKDRYSQTQAYYLKRFAQGPYYIKTYPYGGIGMLILKVNKGITTDIVNWTVQEFNSKLKVKHK
ncbi:MAG: alpha/beta fold hydrolase [Candidatus Gastranaerophilales bacterium]|nr:alpha/beta fold hydrolase [Candidatus Gastranaerophilales bacterium]